jgi:hypothetical protein
MSESNGILRQTQPSGAKEREGEGGEEAGRALAEVAADRDDDGAITDFIHKSRLADDDDSTDSKTGKVTHHTHRFSCDKKVDTQHQTTANCCMQDSDCNQPACLHCACGKVSAHECWCGKTSGRTYWGGAHCKKLITKPTPAPTTGSPTPVATTAAPTISTAVLVADAEKESEEAGKGEDALVAAMRQDPSTPSTAGVPEDSWDPGQLLSNRFRQGKALVSLLREKVFGAIASQNYALVSDMGAKLKLVDSTESQLLAKIVAAKKRAKAQAEAKAEAPTADPTAAPTKKKHDPFIQALAALTKQPHLQVAQRAKADKLVAVVGARRFYKIVQRVRSEAGGTDPDGWWVLQDAAYAQGKKVRVLFVVSVRVWVVALLAD